MATVRLQAGEPPTPELPAVTDLTARLDHYAGAVWRVLEWSPALDDATATDYAFGIWLSPEAPPNLDDPPTEQIPRRAWLNRCEHCLRQIDPVYVAVAALAPDGTRGREARLFLDWSSERPAAPGRQWAELPVT